MDNFNRPMTVAQALANKIREQILTRELCSGEPLRQNALSEQFGTSIIPVREALKQLEAEGFVELRSHRGAVVTDLTIHKAVEWINMRQLIETDMIGAAIEKIQPEDLAMAEQAHERFNAALDKRTDISRWSDFNWEFHSILYRPAGRPETMKILSLLHGHCDRYIRLQLLDSEHIARAQLEHLELIEICRNRNKRSAQTWTHRHIGGVKADLIKIFGN